MHLAEKNVICMSNECIEAPVVETKPVIEKQSCACGSNFKKIYHTPVLKVYGTISDIIHLGIDPRRIYKDSKE
jgi:hypothetical protein